MFGGKYTGTQRETVICLRNTFIFENGMLRLFKNKIIRQKQKKMFSR